MTDASEVRETLLKSARAAGERYIQIRGVDLETAITGNVTESKPVLKSATEKKDN